MATTPFPQFPKARDGGRFFFFGEFWTCQHDVPQQCARPAQTRYSSNRRVHASEARIGIMRAVCFSYAISDTARMPGNLERRHPKRLPAHGDRGGAAPGTVEFGKYCLIWESRTTLHLGCSTTEHRGPENSYGECPVRLLASMKVIRMSHHRSFHKKKKINKVTSITFKQMRSEHLLV